MDVIGFSTAIPKPPDPKEGRNSEAKVTENFHHLVVMKLKNESLKYGLTVNVHKTKYLKCSRRQYQLKAIDTENKEIEQVRSFKYLVSTVNRDNKIEEEIKERIALGNKAFFANKEIFQSKLMSKNAKLKLYFSII